MLAVEHRLDIRFGDAALEARQMSLVRLMQQQEELARAVQKARSLPPQRTVSEPRRPERKPEPSPDGPERWWLGAPHAMLTTCCFRVLAGYMKMCII
jgi:hypothetical protein